VRNKVRKESLPELFAELPLSPPKTPKDCLPCRRFWGATPHKFLAHLDRGRCKQCMAFLRQWERKRQGRFRLRPRQPLATEAVRCLTEWFEANPVRLVDVVAGPKREHWFNAEAYVALSHAGGTETFILWGEQEWRTALKETRLTPIKRLARLKPDLVARSYKGGIADIRFIIEAKLIYSYDTISDRSEILTKLHEQLTNAKAICPNASVVGLIYLVWHGGAGKDLAVSFYKKVGRQIEDIFAKKQQWIRQPSALRGLEATLSRRGIKWQITSFHSYPNIPTSVGVAALQI